MHLEFDMPRCRLAVSFRGLLMLACCGFFFVGTNTPAQAQVPPANKAAIARGTAYLSDQLSKGGGADGGEVVLAAYAMIKGGRDPADPAVAKIVKTLVAKIRRAKNGAGGGRSIYVAGCNMMLLEAASEKKGTYLRELQMLVDYVAKEQKGSGFWNYGGGDQYGDTSVTQYGVLGLWAAQRAGIKVPPTAWDKTARWLVTTQLKQGGFAYRPNEPNEDPSPSHSMTVAGATSLLVAQMYLYPNNPVGFNSKKRKKKKKKKKISVLEDIDLSKTYKEREKKKKKVKVNFKPSIAYAQMHGSAARGLGWYAKRFALPGGSWPLYTMYGVERLAALADVRLIAGKDWYAIGSAYLLKSQGKDGSWKSSNVGSLTGTAFAILFLSKSTASTLGLETFYGAGLMKSGYGLKGLFKDEKKTQVKGSLDVLLDFLLKPGKLQPKGLIPEIIVRYKLGNKPDWLKPERRKKLLKMLNHPRPDVRGVAVWALGRTSDTDVAGLIVKILEDDPSLDVAIEARIALCWISRKPTGFGLARYPTQNLPSNATKKQKTDAIKKWRSDAKKYWRKWYFTIRPYDERDDLSEKRKN
ncbi:MAG: hypothetical protein IID45_04430 [Planctomycetes bacterium]|nr:hypothetical protein [Planctomycetota bacterium]